MSEYNWKFYQYLRSERMRTYKEIENDNDANKELIESLKTANENSKMNYNDVKGVSVN